MKYILTFLIFISSINAYELNWLSDYDKALELSKKEKKNIYIFIGADNCRFCERFKDLTLSKKEVIDTIENDYIPLYLNRDRHFIPKHFVTQGVPRHYFIKPNGEIIHKDAGSREPAGFYDILDEVELKLDSD